jgi:hypothetical protein
MPRCEHCPANYSTEVELARHVESVWNHLRDRLDAEVAAHLQTKLDASQVWTEHLTECEEQVGYERGRASAFKEAEAILREVLPGHFTAIERFRDAAANNLLTFSKGP